MCSLVILMSITINGLNQFLRQIPVVVLLLILLMFLGVLCWLRAQFIFLDLVLTKVTDRVKVITMAPLGTSDHSAISIQLYLRLNIPAYTVTKEVSLKGRVN